MSGLNMIGFEFSMFPTAAVLVKDFDNLGLDIRSYNEPLKRSVQQVMAPSFQKNFDVGGRPPWEPLSDVTLEQKQRYGYGGEGILVRTGLLKKVVGQLNIWTIDRETAQLDEWGAARADYGVDLHEGTATIPARPFLVMQAEDIDGITQVFDTWIGERLIAHGFV
jgi:phage gpG-like protein